MNASTPTPKPQPGKLSPTPKVAPVKKARWWLEYKNTGNPPRARAVIRWRRVGIALGVLCVAGYLSLATALWGYYRFYRDIPSVAWIDIAVLTRFPRVQAAIGSHYLDQAKVLWEEKEYVRALLTARAAVQKSPSNLEASLFLAKSWQDAARYDEAIRTLQNSMALHAKDKRLQRNLVELCLLSGRYDDLLRMLREEFPARGVNLLDGADRGFQLAEIRAMVELGLVVEAEKAILAHAGLAEVDDAAPLRAMIDWELGRGEMAYQRLTKVLERKPEDSAILDAYLDSVLRLGKLEEARTVSKRFLRTYPNLVPAQLRFLEAHDPSRAEDRRIWMDQCIRSLVQYRGIPAALQRLGNLAAMKGWTDLAYLLYENGLQDEQNGFPYVIFYITSLIKAGEIAKADAVWQELSAKNGQQLASLYFLQAMISSGLGRESEASQIINRLRSETADKIHERNKLGNTFSQFGFKNISAQLLRPDGEQEARSKVVR